MTVIIVVPLACTLVLTVGGVWKEGVREGGRDGGRGGEGKFYEDHPSVLIVQEQTQQG